MKIAQVPNDIKDIFGDKITPPPGSSSFADPVAGFGHLMVTGLRLFIIVAALFLLFFMLWGAFDWVTSSGEKEKISKAQSKITNAVIGFFMIFVALAVFGLVTGNILGVIKNEPGQGWTFSLPTL